MCPNVIICMHLGGEHIMCPNAIICMHFRIVLDAVGGKGVRKLYYLQALRASGCDQRAHHVRKCYYLHTVMGDWSPPCAQMLLFACI